MGVVLRRHHRFILTLIVLVLLFILSSFAASSLNRFSGRLGECKKETGGSGLPGWILDQKLLSGPGSVPPRCRSKCGKCEPCKAVHVPIQIGLIKPLEYYPEAWRCKCGNQIFIP